MLSIHKNDSLNCACGNPEASCLNYSSGRMPPTPADCQRFGIFKLVDTYLVGDDHMQVHHASLQKIIRHYRQNPESLKAPTINTINGNLVNGTTNVTMSVGQLEFTAYLDSAKIFERINGFLPIVGIKIPKQNFARHVTELVIPKVVGLGEDDLNMRNATVSGKQKNSFKRIEEVKEMDDTLKLHEYAIKYPEVFEAWGRAIAWINNPVSHLKIEAVNARFAKIDYMLRSATRKLEKTKTINYFGD